MLSKALPAEPPRHFRIGLFGKFRAARTLCSGGEGGIASPLVLTQKRAVRAVREVLQSLALTSHDEATAGRTERIGTAPITVLRCDKNAIVTSSDCSNKNGTAERAASPLDGGCADPSRRMHRADVRAYPEGGGLLRQ